MNLLMKLKEKLKKKWKKKKWKKKVFFKVNSNFQQIFVNEIRNSKFVNEIRRKLVKMGEKNFEEKKTIC